MYPITGIPHVSFFTFRDTSSGWLFGDGSTSITQNGQSKQISRSIGDLMDQPVAPAARTNRSIGNVATGLTLDYELDLDESLFEHTSHSRARAKSDGKMRRHSISNPQMSLNKDRTSSTMRENKEQEVETERRKEKEVIMKKGRSTEDVQMTVSEDLEPNEAIASLLMSSAMSTLPQNMTLESSNNTTLVEDGLTPDVLHTMDKSSEYLTPEDSETDIRAPQSDVQVEVGSRSHASDLSSTVDDEQSHHSDDAHKHASVASYDTKQTALSESQQELKGQDSEPEMRDQDSEPEMRGQDSEPKTRGQDFEPETRGQDSKPEMRGQDSETETRGQDSELETKDQYTESETKDHDLEPYSETELEITGQDSEPETRDQDTEPKTKDKDSEDTEPKTQDKDSGLETKRQTDSFSVSSCDTSTSSPDKPINRAVTTATPVSNSNRSAETGSKVAELRQMFLGFSGTRTKSKVSSPPLSYSRYSWQRHSSNPNDISLPPPRQNKSHVQMGVDRPSKAGPSHFRAETKTRLPVRQEAIIEEEEEEEEEEEKSDGEMLSASRPDLDLTGSDEVILRPHKTITASPGKRMSPLALFSRSMSDADSSPHKTEQKEEVQSPLLRSSSPKADRFAATAVRVINRPHWLVASHESDDGWSSEDSETDLIQPLMPFTSNTPANISPTNRISNTPSNVLADNYMYQLSARKKSQQRASEALVSNNLSNAGRAQMTGLTSIPEES